MRSRPDRGQAHLPPPGVIVTRRIRRNALPDLPRLDRLEEELHGTRPSAPLIASAEADLVSYVRENPGATVKEVLLEGRGLLSHKTAEGTIRDLLAAGVLRSDRPGVPFHGRHQLYVADDGEPDSENRL